MLLDHNSANNAKLKQLQDIMFEIALIFKEICEKHNLRYYMMYGTLLGAVRHQNFIPWDDDMDFAMPRRDWEKFICIAPKELELLGEGNYALRECRLDNGKYKSLGIRLVDKRMVFAPTSRLAYIGGIYIDITPLDGAFENRYIRKIHSKLIDQICTLNWYFVYRKQESVKKMTNRLGLCLARFLFDNILAYRFMHYIISIKNYETSKYVKSIAFNSEKEILPKEFYEEPCKLKIRDVEFYAPAEYDRYLRHFYGDYMTPLPESQREQHYDLADVDAGERCIEK